MTEDRARTNPGPSASSEAGVTGIAKGSLGTGTALEETQVWDVAELQAADTAPEAQGQPRAQSALPAPDDLARRAPVATPRQQAKSPPAVAPSAAAPVVVAAVPEGRVVTSRQTATRPAGGFAATPRAAGLAAVVLLALVGMAAVVTSRDRNPGAGATPVEQPTAGPTAAAPTAAPAVDAGGGSGKDRDKDDKGGGNGKGKNEGGNGSD